MKLISGESNNYQHQKRVRDGTEYCGSCRTSFLLLASRQLLRCLAGRGSLLARPRRLQAVQTGLAWGRGTILLGEGGSPFGGKPPRPYAPPRTSVVLLRARAQTSVAWREAPSAAFREPSELAQYVFLQASGRSIPRDVWESPWGQLPQPGIWHSLQIPKAGNSLSLGPLLSDRNLESWPRSSAVLKGCRL